MFYNSCKFSGVIKLDMEVSLLLASALPAGHTISCLANTCYLSRPLSSPVLSLGLPKVVILPVLLHHDETGGQLVAGNAL